MCEEAEGEGLPEAPHGMPPSDDMGEDIAPPIPVCIQNFVISRGTLTFPK